MDQFESEYGAYLQKLSDGAVVEGVLCEPRIYWDRIALSGTNIAVSEEGVFRNGEEFPVRITHMVASTAYLDQDDSVDDEWNIQRIGMHLRFHDQYYMNPPQQLAGQFALRASPVPTWGNTLTNTSDLVNPGSVTLRPKRPFVLSTRDSMRVSIGLADPNDTVTNLVVCVSFTGVGIISKQPYMLTGTGLITGPAPTEIASTLFVNDGAEPVLIRDCTITTTSDFGDEADITGDARRVAIQIRQVGNGTGANWTSGPTSKGLPDLCPAILFGNHGGRGVVHEFPLGGPVWEPGESLSVEAQGLTSAVGDASYLLVALVGYIAVQ